MSEYLRGFRTARIEGVAYPDMLLGHRILSPSVLASELNDAFRHLVTVPGPHILDRQAYAPSWIPWWTRYLGTLPDTGEILVPNAKLALLDELQERLYGTPSSGLLFAAGAEGHEGHRFAAWWMKKHVDKTVLMLEEEEYLEGKARGGSYLPLEVRLSMWAHHPHVDFVSVVPRRDKEKYPDVDQYYKDVFRHTGAQYCFATENDPWEEAKRSRGKEASFTRIPLIDTPSTTDRVARLMPDNEDNEENGTLMEAPFLMPFTEEFEDFKSFDGLFS